MDFSGKVVIVTGASSGIGAATAKLFASQGALLTIIGRNEERLSQVATECTAAKGNTPLSLLLDLTHENTCKIIAEKTIQTYGKLDILVNCAGKLGLTSLFDNNMESFDEIIALNLRVPYQLTQHCVPHLKLTKGSIINVFAAPIRSSFIVCSMVRDALERFTKTGALELASVGVRMNAVRPGITRTNLLTNLNFEGDTLNEAYDNLAKFVPTKKIIEPEEIARMVLFAASDICPSMSGSNLLVDGSISYHAW